MFSCWLLSPKDRPSFEDLRWELEKALDDLPDAQDPDEILYVNMDETSSEQGAVGGRDPVAPGTGGGGGGGGGAPPLGLKGLDSVTTVEVHHHNRYVLCPQHEPVRGLADSLESLDMAVSSSAATLPLPDALPAHGHPAHAGLHPHAGAAGGQRDAGAPEIALGVTPPPPPLTPMLWFRD